MEATEQHYTQLSFDTTHQYYGNYLLHADPRFFTARYPFYWYQRNDAQDMGNEPEFHHYHCGDAECDYCCIAERGMRWYDYELSDYMTFEQFNTMFPIELSTENGELVWNRFGIPLQPAGLLAYNYCEPIDEEDEDYYDDGTSAGTEVDPEEFEFTQEGWLAPDGTFYYVPDEVGHEGTAKILLYGEGPYNCYCDVLEDRGWIHITDYYGPERFQYVPPRPTKAQIETANLFAEAHGIEVPESLRYQVTFTETLEIKPFIRWHRIEESCKPRSFRDRFYPLSGD